MPLDGKGNVKTIVGEGLFEFGDEDGTPLNVVEARAGMIAAGETEGEGARAYARVVVEACAQMTRIVRQLLDFARPRGPDRAAEDVRGIAAQTVKLLEPLAGKSGVALDLDEGPAAVAEVDAGQVQQVLTNVVVNAVQAMTGPGPVRITVERAHATPPGSEAAGEYVLTRVRDRGRDRAGDLPHVFERRRRNAAGSRSRTGTAVTLMPPRTGRPGRTSAARTWPR